MPQLDASLIGGFKPIELPDPVNQLTKYLQLSGLQQKQQSGALELQQAQQSAQETNALRQYLSDPANQGQDPNALRAGIQRVAPIAGQPIIKGMLDTQKTQGEIQGTTLGNADKARTAIGSLAGSLATTKPDLNPNDLSMFAQQAAKMGVTVDPQEFAGARNPDGSFNADAARQVLLRYKTQAMTPDQQAQLTKPQFLATEQGIAGVQPTIDGSPATGYMVGNVQGAATSRNGQPGMGPGIAPPVAPASPANFPRVTPAMQVSRDSDRLAILQDELTKTTNPSDRAAIQSEIARTTATQAAGTPFAGQGVPQAPQQAQAAPAVLGAKPQGSWEKDPMSGQMVYAPKFANPGDTLNAGGYKLTPSDQAVVDQMGKYQIAPISTSAGARNPREMAIMGALSAQYPSFDATEFPARQKALRDFSTGVQGNALRSVSVASDHLDQLAQAGDALKNGNYQLVNKVANAFGTQTGDSAQTSFNAIKQIVGDEVLKAVIGGGAGGVSDRAELAAQLKDASSPKQLADVITQYRHLMAAQKDALVAQYENTTGRTDAATRFNFGKKGTTPAAPAGWNVQVVNQ